MPGPRTEITEIATGLGTLSPDLDAALACRCPDRLRNVPDEVVWGRVVDGWAAGASERAFATAFANGLAFL